jgi:hypothetical protein
MPMSGIGTSKSWNMKTGLQKIPTLQNGITYMPMPAAADTIELGRAELVPDLNVVVHARLAPQLLAASHPS